MALVPLERAQELTLAPCAPLPAVAMAVGEARGLVLAERIVATEAVPPFANTAMDGFAVRAADTAAAPVTLAVVGTVRAGEAPTRPVGPGEAVRIMTGAPMPAEADAVVMVERTRMVDDDRVEVEVAVAEGTNVRPAGDDLRPGDEVLDAGDVLSPARIGLVSGVGVVEVLVHPRPRVGVLSTGDELVSGPGPLAPGAIRDSNRPALLALLDELGAEAIDLGTIRDEEQAIEASLTAAIDRCDVVITTGGVSMGDFDYVKVVLDRIADMRWMQLAIKPAKPLAFGTAGRDGRVVPIFGLPGNPVSSLVSFELFARRAIRRMAGHRDLDRPRYRAVTDADLARRPDGKTHFVRVRIRWDLEDGRVHVASAGAQGSHQLSAMAAADGLAVLPDGPLLPAGSDVEVLDLRVP